MRSALLLVLLLASACRTTGSPTTTSPVDTAGSSGDTAGQPGPGETGAPSDPGDTGTAGSSTLVQIKAADAVQHGLPGVAFSVDTAGTPLLATPFPDTDEYLAVSGPPGGPQIIRIQALPEPPADAAALEPLLRERFNRPGSEPLVFGTPTRVSLAGAEHPALPLVTGSSMARTGWCAVAVAAGPAGGPPGLLVLVGIGTQGDPDCAVPLGDEQLKRLLDTLRLEPSSGAAAAAPERRWRVSDGGFMQLEISSIPGAIIDTNAPPPPPGVQPATNPFLSAACGGDPLPCSRAGALLRASTSLEEYLDKLRAEGWTVEQLP